MDDKTISQQVIRCVLTMPDDEFAVLSVGELARLFEMDRYKLSRHFKSQTGITLEEFLYKEKMTRAVFLLLTYRDITVKKVAERIGFCSQDYFVRKFRQFYGVVPGKYSEFKAGCPGVKDRCKEVKDRGQQNSSYNDHANPNMLPGGVLEAKDGKKGIPCENCYFRKFALNFDDLK
jgi:AraC-like DNA-binding protein